MRQLNKTKVTILLLLVIGSLLVAAVAFAEGSPAGKDDVEKCTPEEVRQDPTNCRGGWVSSTEAGTIKPRP